MDSEVIVALIGAAVTEGKVRAAKVLPWDICCWNCGNRSKGSYNHSPS